MTEQEKSEREILERYSYSNCLIENEYLDLDVSVPVRFKTFKIKVRIGKIKKLVLKVILD